MSANKLENYEFGKVSRADIRGADYNPRKISESAKKKLRKNIKENGLVQPIIVNRRTMNVVGGHQRLAVMDDLMKCADYEMSVALIDVDEKKEVELNIFLNNPAAQGEWDMILLGDISNVFPDIDFVADLGFDASDLDVMFGEDFSESFKAEYDDFSRDAVAQAKQDGNQQPSSDDFRAMKKEMREKAKAENEADGSFNLDKADYTLTVVFPNNSEKQDFMRKIRKPLQEKYVKSTIFYDIAHGAYDISAKNSNS